MTQYFDLIAGTSTGGIIALGLAAGLSASRLRNLYVERGHEIFPPDRRGAIGVMQRPIRKISRLFRYRYDGKALSRVLEEAFADRKLGDAQTRLCIPSFDGRYGEVYIFKTPHHPDFRWDAKEHMTSVAMATAAAPTFYRPLEHGGYTFVDGGVWANNPIMVALVDSLSCFALQPEQVRILSLGCGEMQYLVDRSKTVRGGSWAWRDIFDASLRLQSQNALGQAGLLTGNERIMRVNVPTMQEKIELDDWIRAIDHLPNAAEKALERFGEKVASSFFLEPVCPYKPFSQLSSSR